MYPRDAHHVPASWRIAAVRRPLQHHAERPGSHRLRDVRGQPRAVARGHEHEVVLGDRVPRLRRRHLPDLVVVLDHAGRAAAHQPEPAVHHFAADILAPEQRVALPGRAHHHLRVLGQHHVVAVHGHLVHGQHGLAGTSLQETDVARVRAGKVRETHPAPALEAELGLRAERHIHVPVASQRVAGTSGAPGEERARDNGDDE